MIKAGIGGREGKKRRKEEREGWEAGRGKWSRQVAGRETNYLISI